MTEDTIVTASRINNTIKAVNKFIADCEGSVCINMSMGKAWGSSGSNMHIEDKDLADLIIDHLKKKVEILKKDLEEM